jgi:hypothetical protein
MLKKDKNQSRFVFTVFFTGLLIICFISNGCSREPSFKERLELTKKYQVDYLVNEAKSHPGDVIIKQISDKVIAAYATIQKEKNLLNKPYLSNVLLWYKALNETNGKKEVYAVYLDWFEKRFIPHSIQFKNTETSEVWTYNFQSYFFNAENKAVKALRYVEEYQFGIQERDGKLIPLEVGIKFTELAKKQKLTAALVKEDGTVISNEVKVDYIEVPNSLPNNDNKQNVSSDKNKK